MPERKKVETFIKESKQIYNNKYDYSKMNYLNNRTDIILICKKHEINFKVKPYNHLKGSECPLCNNNQKMNNDIFLKKSINVHNNKYNYFLVNYKNNKTKIKIICILHGIFEQRPNDHLNGQGCPECKKNKISEKNKMGKNIFIERSNELHNCKYDYSKVIYENVDKKVEIICKVHGSFFQLPKNHLNNQGCPSCKMSNGESKIKFFLDRMNIKYIYQYKFKDCLSSKNK